MSRAVPRCSREWLESYNKRLAASRDSSAISASASIAGNQEGEKGGAE